MTTKRLAIMTVFCLIGFVAQDASAFYAPHLGRFLTRDPNGEMGVSHVAVGPPAGLRTGRFIARDIIDEPGPGVDLMAQYSDGMNLYQYVRSQPTLATDPSGLIRSPPGTFGNCSYYRQKCRSTNGFFNPCQKAYYCAAANAVCNMAGNGAWRDCVRTCLQCRDKDNSLPDNENPVFGFIFGCVVKAGGQAIDHLVCFTKCRWDTSSYKGGNCPCE